MFGWLKNIMGGVRRDAPPPVPRGPLSEQALRAALERPFAPLVFRKPANIDPFASMFGAVRLSRKDEAWPLHHGAPMWPLCQINLAQAPYRPDALGDLSLLTVFVASASDAPLTQVIDTRKPDPSANWALRSYPTLEGLTIPKIPAHGNLLSPRLGEWGGVHPDYANHDMAGEVIDTAANDVYAYDWARTVQQTKIGGWPGTVQSEPWWDREKSRDRWTFVMQIENEPKAGWDGWGDGAAFLARSARRPYLWAIDVQFT